MIFIGIDIGSTAVKAIAVDDKGNILSRGKQAYLTEVSGVESTQYADEWWNSAVSAVRQTVAGLKNPGDVSAISISAQGGSIFALDKEYKPLTKALTWMDRRGFAEAEEIKGVFGESVYRACGWPTSPSDCASKILWLKRYEPEIFSSASKFLTTEEYINYKLTGKAVTDPSGAAITRLYNINTRRYYGEMLGYLGISEDKLPDVLPCSAELGHLCKSAARDLGLGEHVVVYNGAHDQYCASLGAGVIKKGELLLATGTAWVIFGVTGALNFNEKHIAPGIHPVTGIFGAMTSLGSIGAQLEKCSDTIGLPLPEIDRVAASRGKSDEGLLICPVQPGKGIVTHREDCTLYGLCDKHDEYDKALALMEGAAFEVRLAVEEFRKQGMMADMTLTMSGGAARSELWSSLVGYICENDVMLTVEPDTPALGAAMIAAVNAGAFANYAECAGVFVRKKHIIPYDKEFIILYSEKFRHYRNRFII